jgi:hypothetical protein
LHLTLFEQPGKYNFFQQPLGVLRSSSFTPRRATKVAPTHDVSYSKEVHVLVIGYWVIGIYLDIACLPVGRGFGYWNFMFYLPPTK